MTYKDKLESLKKKSLNSVGVGAKEAAYRFEKPFTKASRDTIFIHTSPIDDRVILVKKDTEPKKLKTNSTCIECSIIVK